MMRTIKFPQQTNWESLAKRPIKSKVNLDDVVKDILSEVKSQGDAALLNYTKLFDNAQLESLQVSEEELENAVIEKELQEAIELAKGNIEGFHQSQVFEEAVIETTAGVKCWRKSVPIEKVGLYIPGGSAPLFSTVLMLGIPAQIAGCTEIILCTPPDKNGKVHPAILFTAKLIGIKKIFKVGGAQAVAAMAYGTESVPQVSKIFGPGNQFVTKTKSLVQQSGVAIDMPAGPSEVLVIADDSCNPTFVAADLLSQAEHGKDSQVILLSNSDKVVESILNEVATQMAELPRSEIAEEAIKNSCAILLNSLDECIAFSNLYAPEHLILTSQENEKLIDKVVNAGSVFIGEYSCESAGDYASGTNHTLPTNGYAKNYSRVSVDSFVKKITFQELSAQGIQNIGPSIELMAEAEQLLAHKNAVTVRLNALRDV
jgi:histidinol dehydrogenase